MDAVQKANSGHPGTPMALAPLAFTLYTRVMRHSPENPDWFNRDRFVCAFCAGNFSSFKLTCDHILPLSRGGRDTWMNVVTACRTCNQKKGNRTPEEAHMQLVYAPYVPNRAEFLILANRRILADQMEFLRQHVSANSRVN